MYATISDSGDQISNKSYDITSYKNKIKENINKIPFVLEDFEKIFILYNKNPDNNEYYQTLENIKSNMDGFNNELFTIEQKLQTNTDELNSNLKKMYIQINQLKTQNAKLKHSVVILEQGVSSTDELIDNYKDYYEISYLRNWGLFLTILASWGIMSVVFKPRQILNLNSSALPKPK
jgi:chromosome segregation ATPase